MPSILDFADEPGWRSKSSAKQRRQVRRILKWFGRSAAKWYKRKRGIVYGIYYWRGFREEFIANITMNNSLLAYLKRRDK